MIKIPFFNKYLTDDQNFYDHQVDEELKFLDNSKFIFRFAEVGKSKRAIIIRFRDESKKTILIPFAKHDYKGINEAVELIRLNIACSVKEITERTENSEEEKFDISSFSKDEVTVGNEDEKEKKVIISKVDDLQINGKAFKSKEELIKSLIDMATFMGEDGPYLDFFKAEYDAGLQNYLLMSLYKEPISLNDKLVNAISLFKYKAPQYYHVVNSFMRGNFDEMINYLESIKQTLRPVTVAKICQNLIQASEELPLRTYDVMIYRVGSGETKDKSIGARNINESFSSFGTSGGTLGTPLKNGKQPIIYKRILRKTDRAIPVDLIENLGMFYMDGTQENEFLLLPFVFEIKDKSKDGKYDVYEIKEIEPIDARKLFSTRLDELEEYFKSKNMLENYDELLKARSKITAKSKKTVSEYNMKDVYYGLRPDDIKCKKRDYDFTDR